MAKVLALVESDAREGTVRRSACALLTLARRLGEPVAVVGGPAPAEETIRTLGRYGATEIWCLADSDAAAPAPAPAPAADRASPLPSPRNPSALAAGQGLAAGSTEGSAAVRAGRSDCDPKAEDAKGSAAVRAGRSDCDPKAEDAKGSAAARAGLPDREPKAEGSRFEFSSTTDVDLLTALARRLDPAAVLIASSNRGRETAARLAIRLDSGIITDAVDILPGPDGHPVAIQHCLAGSYYVESTVVRGVPIITVGPEAAVPEPRPADPALHTIAVEPSKARAPRIAAVPKPRTHHPALDHADIVVAGGRGVGSRAAFAVLAEVAEALGAAVAGSHTAAELGWIPPEARVGLTGKTVHPRLYLACGVSGSVRHRAGMQGAKTVVAIGKDPEAPIFKLADLGVVGDAGAILPALLAEIRSRTQTGARGRDAATDATDTKADAATTDTEAKATTDTEAKATTETDAATPADAADPGPIS